MIRLTLALVVAVTAAEADTSCALKPAQAEEPTTLLIRGLGTGDEAAVLVDGRTLIFDCPAHILPGAYECYGSTGPPMNAPTQLNITRRPVAAGDVVVVSVRNAFFGKNEHIGYHRRHASMHVFLVEGCEEF